MNFRHVSVNRTTVGRLAVANDSTGRGPARRSATQSATRSSPAAGNSQGSQRSRNLVPVVIEIGTDSEEEEEE